MDDATARDRGEGARRLSLAWLAHPVSVAAVAVMALNDHVLKVEFGNVFTGKLSDVAGLVFAPALLAVAVAGAAPRVQRRPLAIASIAATAVLFAAVKASPAGAAAASAALTSVAGPSLIRADLTDLLALPALGLAWFTLRRAARSHSGPRVATRAGRARAVILIGFATVATVATSPVEEPSAVNATAAEDSAVIAVSNAAYWGDEAYYETADGSAWAETCEREGPCPVEVPFAETTETCVSDSREVCYRVAAAGIGVDRSDDTGATWAADWSLTDAELRRIARFHGVAKPDEYLRTHSIAVLRADAGGHIVVAANGRDGFAVRWADGTWERRGFADAACCEDIALTPLAADKPLPTVHVVSAKIAAFATIAPLALAAAVWLPRVKGSRRRRIGHTADLKPIGLAAGGSIVGAALVAGALILSLDETYAARGAESGDPFLLSGGVLMLAGLGTIAIFVGSLPAVAAPYGVRWGSYVAALGAVAAAVFALFLWQPESAQLGAALLVAGGAACAVLALAEAFSFTAAGRRGRERRE